MDTHRPIRLALALVLLSGLTQAGSVRIAERPLLGPFPTIQAGVDAALEGESLLVTPGTYASFTIDGKSVHVVVGGVGAVNITGNVVVKNLTSTQSAFLSRLVVKGVNGFGAIPPALEVSNVLGHVRLHECSFEGAGGTNANSQAGPGVRVLSSLNTVFSGCHIEGGYPGYLSGYPWIDGGIGLDAVNSPVVLYDCTVEGGEGSNESTPRGGHGGRGYSGLNYGLFASGCTIRGGRGGGGDFTGCYPGGVGGDGLVVDSGQAHLLSSTTSGGLGGWYLCGPNSAPGSPTTLLNGSVLNQLAGSARKISAPRITADDVSIPITITGQPGDSVYLLMGRRPAWTFKPALKGVWMVLTPLFATAQPAGTIGADGTLVVSRSFEIPDGSSATNLRWMQAVCIDTGGGVTLTGPAEVLSVDTSAALTWYVDAAAPAGGNGSQIAPFQTLQSAVASAFHGDTIVLANGTYQGTGNKSLNPGGRSFRLRSANGGSPCTIDCQGSGRAFSILLGEQVTIDGLSFVNGAAFGNAGGAIEARYSQLWLRNCGFTSNGSGSGGAVSVTQGALRLEGCSFLSNSAPNAATGVGGAVSLHLSTLTGRDCLFAFNQAGARGGALQVGQSASGASPVILTHSTFLGNQAAFGGAVHVLQAPASALHVLGDCLFAGNHAGTDGGAWMGPASLLVGNTTFASNSAPGRGGALYLLAGSASDLRNSILHDNAAGQGPQIFLGDGTLPQASLAVSFSDVQGGQAAVWVQQGVLSWGAGNLDLDPLFADPDGADNNPSTFNDNDYSLSASSPCIDAADNGALLPDVLDVDGDRNTIEPTPLDQRHFPRRVDVISVPDTGAGSAPIVDMGAIERQG